METSKFNPFTHNNNPYITDEEWLTQNKWPSLEQWEENKDYYTDPKLNEIRQDIHQIKLTLELMKLDIKKLEENQ